MMTSHKNQGFSLIEVMVATFIFATGILGIASLQMKSLGALSNSGSIGIAMLGVSDVIDRMHANPTGVTDGFYDNLDDTSVSNQSCGSTCSTMQLAQQDVFSVFQQLSQELPSPSLSVSNQGNNIFTVEVTWLERNGEQSETKRHRISFLPYKP